MRIWKISPGRNAMNWEQAVEGECIFIGWNEMEDLNHFESQEDLIEHYQEVYKIDHNPTNNGWTLWAFSHVIEPGDIVIANKGSRSIVGIGIVTGEYQYLPDENPDYPNVRKVNWVIQHEIDLREKMFPMKTLAEIQDGRVETIHQRVLEQVENGEEKWKTLFGDDYQPYTHDDEGKQRHFIDEFHTFIKHKNFSFSREMIARFVLSLVSKPFVILSGISGTGKTKIAQLFVEFMSEQGVEKADQPQEHRDTNAFEYPLQPYSFKYTRMILPKMILEQFDAPELEKGLTVTLHFGHHTEEALMKEQARGVVRLGFRKGFMDWLRKHFKLGDTLYIQFSEDGRTWHFNHSQTSYQKAEPQHQVISKQHAFLSVRPDWLDHRGLLGYYNPITQSYQVTDMLKIMLRAQRFPEHPFFVILDEMNLAKVEYYFSDFLSCLESRRVNEDGELIQEKIVLHHEDQEVAQSMSFVDEDGAVYNIPTSIEIPKNLYIIGTVNVDETTYMFSPKVLDRAHVIECNEVDFETYRRTAMQRTTEKFKSTWSPEEKLNWFTADGYFHHNLYMKEFLSPDIQSELEPLFTLADQLKSLMMNEGYSFGYRVFDEMFAFIIDATEYGGFQAHDTFDIMILQKILPKLHGNRAQMEPVLNQLFQFCRAEQAVDEEGNPSKTVYAHAILEDHKGDYSGFRFKRSADKIQTMYKQLLRTGYCSFIQ